MWFLSCKWSSFFFTYVLCFFLSMKHVQVNNEWMNKWKWMNDPRDIFAQPNSTIITLLFIGLSLYRNMPVVIRLLTNRLHIKSNITSYVVVCLVSGISFAMIVEICFFFPYCVKENFFSILQITLFFYIFYRPTSTSNHLRCRIYGEKNRAEGISCQFD